MEHSSRLCRPFILQNSAGDWSNSSKHKQEPTLFFTIMGKDKDKKKKDEQNLKVLMELVQEPDNSKCADCEERSE